MKFVAGSQKIALSPDTHIDATVGIGPTAHGFGIEVELRIHVPVWSVIRRKRWWTRHTPYAPTPTPRAAIFP